MDGIVIYGHESSENLMVTDRKFGVAATGGVAKSLMTTDTESNRTAVGIPGSC